MKSTEELLEELCLSQYLTLKFLNKVMINVVKEQRNLPVDLRNTDLMNLAWETNDIIVDHQRESEIQRILDETYGIVFKIN